MKTAEEFLEETVEKVRKEVGGKGDYRKMYPKCVAIRLMSDFADYATDSLTQEINDQGKLLVGFMQHIRSKGVAFSKDYTQEDFERIAFVYLFCEDPDSEEESDAYVEPTNRPDELLPNDDLFVIEAVPKQADATKNLLHDIISWEKDLSEYESLEAILRQKYLITQRL
jgi:hypothetical protein